MNSPVPGYRPWCPKCRHPRLSAEHEPRLHTAVVSCYMCGWSLYGDDNVAAFVEKQSAEFSSKPKKRTPQKRWARPKRAFRPASVVPAVPAQKPVADPTPEIPTCAWKDCSKPVRVSRGKPTKYCSRKCCVKNAHARDRARRAKKAKKDGRSD
jgi:hypothetical protein